MAPVDRAGPPARFPRGQRPCAAHGGRRPIVLTGLVPGTPSAGMCCGRPAAPQPKVPGRPSWPSQQLRRAWRVSDAASSWLQPADDYMTGPWISFMAGSARIDRGAAGRMPAGSRMHMSAGNHVRVGTGCRGQCRASHDRSGQAECHEGGDNDCSPDAHDTLHGPCFSYKLIPHVPHASAKNLYLW